MTSCTDGQRTEEGAVEPMSAAEIRQATAHALLGDGADIVGGLAVLLAEATRDRAARGIRYSIAGPHGLTDALRQSTDSETGRLFADALDHADPSDLTLAQLALLAAAANRRLSISFEKP